MSSLFGWGPGGGTPGNKIGSFARGSAGVAATLLGLRVSRAVTLRISALLALRSLLVPLQLPFDAGIGAFLWSGALAAAQTAALAAAAADRLRLPGLLGRWGAALFSPVDAPFVSLYSVIVLISGPLAALIETVVVVYESIRVTRMLEDRINSSVDASVEASWKRINLAAACSTLVLAGLLICVLPVTEVFFAVAGISALLVLVSLVSAAGNILHAGFLSLYVALLLVTALAEHLDLFPDFGQGPRPKLHCPEARALVLLLSCVANLLCIARAPYFARVVLHSADAVSTDMLMTPGSDTVERGAINALAIVAVTFRFLVFHRDIVQGEYYPLVCRGLQSFVVVCLYAAFMRIEGKEGEE